MKTLLQTICLLWAINIAIAQVPTKRTNPDKFRSHVNILTFSKAQKVILPAVNVQKLLAEDELEKNSNLPFRFGKDIDVDLGIKTHGHWEKNSAGRVWKLQLEAPGALSINLIFDQFYLPQGAELFVYNGDRTMVHGPVTHKHNDKNNKFATDVLQGSSVILELYEPEEYNGQTRLHIAKVVHGYKNLFLEAGFGESGACNVDINCPQGNNWQLQSDAIAMVLLANNTRICSAVLLNNGCQDFEPRVLTAFHCADTDLDGDIDNAEQTDAENWVFRFNYKSPSCGGGDDTHYVSLRRSELLSGFAGSDFALFELRDQPTGEMGITLAGWSRENNPPINTVVGIHHPAGDVMKIAIDGDPPAVQTITGIPNSHWFVDDWDTGTTEGGSSGSPLFDQNGRVIGQDHAGDGFQPCNADKGTFYGRIWRSWTGGGTANTRLRDWLTNDPNVMTTDVLRIPFLVESSNIVVCNTNKSFSFANIPPTASHNITWSTTPNLTIVSSDRHFVMVRYSGSGNGIGTITASVSNVNTGLCPITNTFSKDVQAGAFTTSQVIVSGESAVCKGTVYTYTANIPFGHRSGYTYNWTWPSNWIFISQLANTIRLQTPSVSTPSGGTVSVNVNNGCGTSGFTGLTVFPRPCGFSLAKTDGSELFKQYPNPSSGYFTVEQTPEAVAVGSYSVELLNFFGRKVTSVTTSDKKVSLSTTALPEGHYVLKIRYKDGILTRRIVIE